MHPNVYCSIFIIAKIWKQPECSSLDKWIKKMWYIYTHTYVMGYYSTIKLEILLFATTQIALDNIMLSEINQTKKQKNKYNHLDVESRKQNKQKQNQTHRYREQMGDYQREGGWELSGIGEKDQAVQTTSQKINKPWYEIYSIRNTVNNVIILHGDR